MESWEWRHVEALANPDEQERPMVLLMEAVKLLIGKYSNDLLLRLGVIEILQGMHVLLNADVGRLDKGSVTGFIEDNLRLCGVLPDG